MYSDHLIIGMFSEARENFLGRHLEIFTRIFLRSALIFCHRPFAPRRFT